MANNLPNEKKVLAVSMLAEASSIRSIERITEVHRDTIMRLGVRVGITGEIELRQNWRRGMDLLRRGFSSKDSLQTLLPSSPA